MDKVVIESKKILNSGLSIQAYFVLYCIAYDMQSLLEDYVEKKGKIDKSDFKTLTDEGYLEIKGNDIVFKNLKITDKTKELFEISKVLDHKRFFQELKDVYPKRVKIGKRSRSLHQDMESCEKKYKQLIDSEEFHKKILLCVKAYVKELEDSGRLEFMQMLPTWINQKNYQVYIDDIDSIDNVLEDNKYDIV